MENEPKKPHSWWQTVPGVLGGLAALITALTGLYVAYHQILGQQSTTPTPPRDPGSSSPTQTSSSPTHTSTSTSTPSPDVIPSTPLSSTPDLANLLLGNKIFPGKAIQGSTTHPILLKINLDPKTSSFTGTIEFPRSKATKNIVGGFKGNRVFFNETKLVSEQSTSAYIGISYNLELKVDSNKNQLQGKWNYGGDGGDIVIDLY